jgi:hypothetical protein
MNMSMKMIKNTMEMVIIMFMQSISRIVTIGRSARNSCHNYRTVHGCVQHA